MLFHQLFEAESSTYTYLLADRDSGAAVFIDPVIDTIERDLKLLDEYGLTLKYIVDTHVHADHITAADELRKRTGAQTCVSRHASLPCVDIELKEGQSLHFGPYEIGVLETPGHTQCSLSFTLGDRVFTGDTLLIRGCGRTDFQNGSAELLYKSVREKLFVLPPATRVYPGHDYKGQTSSSIEMEQRFNPRLKDGITLEEFVRIMSLLGLPVPKRIHEALPANLACGKTPQ
ncbi:MAG: MBL fold metallo-hydrolase [Chitinophagaceae bacterium]|nr:MBL fold metallo-hydrolase [Oligoflexus sp.]